MKNQSAPRSPKLCHHEASDRAFVFLDGKRVYLGKWGSAEAVQRYHAVLAEWQSNGCTLPVDPEEITVAEVLARYLDHAESYYVLLDGTPSTQMVRLKSALKVVGELYGETPAAEFGPVRLRAVRERMVSRAHCRRNTNAMIGCIKLAFRWAASHELIPGQVPVNLSMLEGLRYGRTAARETDPIQPVPDTAVHIIEYESARPPRAFAHWSTAWKTRLLAFPAVLRAALKAGGQAWWTGSPARVLPGTVGVSFTRRLMYRGTTRFRWGRPTCLAMRDRASLERWAVRSEGVDWRALGMPQMGLASAAQV